MTEAFGGEIYSPREPQASPSCRLVEEAPDAIVILGPDLTVRYANPAPGARSGTILVRSSALISQSTLHPAEREWARELVLPTVGRKGVLGARQN